MNHTALPLSTSTLGQLAFGVLGGVLIGTGSNDRRSRGLLNVAALALLGVAARPAIERLVRRAGERRRTITYHTTIELDRSVAAVFRFFKDFANFPRVVGGLRSVIDYEDGRSRWESYTPSGQVVTWNVVVTKYVPNHVIGWESVPGSPIGMRVVARFTPLGPERTQLELRGVYHPVRTGLNDAVRALMGPPPLTRLLAGLEHLRFYLESLPEPTAVGPVAKS